MTQSRRCGPLQQGSALCIQPLKQTESMNTTIKTGFNPGGAQGLQEKSSITDLQPYFLWRVLFEGGHVGLSFRQQGGQPGIESVSQRH